MLQFLTGSNNISAYVRKEKIKVHFKEITGDQSTEKIGFGYKANTCEMSIVFPVTQNFIDSAHFNNTFLQFMLNSPGFMAV